MNLKKPLLFVLALLGGMNSFAQLSSDKVYTIVNRNETNDYMQDNGVGVVVLNPKNDNSYWQFIPTAEPNKYYVKNATTGKYMQSSSTNLQEVAMGDTPVEYYVARVNNEGDGMYGMASTDQATFNFTNGTIGCNAKAKADTGRAFDTVQGFAAVDGTNHRSFWKIEEGQLPKKEGLEENKNYTLVNFQDNNYYIKDDRDGYISVASGLTSNALWQFEATGKENCFYVRNTLTGKYIQSSNGNEVEIKSADTPQEFMIINDPAKGVEYYGLASTDQGDLSFEGDRTLGANWKDNGRLQGFPVTLGGRPRSFWKVVALETVDFSDANADNASLIANAAGNDKNVVVTRSLAKGMWNSLVVPNPMNEAAITRNFGNDTKVAKFDNESDNGTLHFVSTTTIEAGVPYLVLPTIDVVNIVTLFSEVKSERYDAQGTAYDFVGVYDQTTIGSGDYFIAADNKLKKNTNANGKLKPFRAYFKQKDETNAKDLIGFDIDNETTGIIGMDGKIETNVKIYNINGQQVSPESMQKGIYIVNGKKTIIK